MGTIGIYQGGAGARCDSEVSKPIMVAWVGANSVDQGRAHSPEREKFETFLHLKEGATLL